MNRKSFHARMKVVKYYHLLTPLIEIITATGISVAIFQAARSSIHLDAVVPVIVALYMSYEPVKKLGGIHNTIKQGLASLKRLQDILHSEETVSEPASPTPLMNISGEIIFENVSFQYPDPSSESIQTPIKAIDSIDLKIQPGKWLLWLDQVAGRQPCRIAQPTSRPNFRQNPSGWKIFAMYHSLN